MDSTQFIQDIVKQYVYYRSLAEKAIDQINEEEFFFQQHEDVNSIAIIVKHIAGNLKSRFTDFRVADGEKSWRNRDEEFIIRTNKKEQVMKLWDEAWTILIDELKALNESTIKETIHIRNQAHTIPTALIRSLSHVAHHIGQILYQAKLLKGPQWESLSIPKGESQQFNTEMLDTNTDGEHYTDHLLKRD